MLGQTGKPRAQHKDTLQGAEYVVEEGPRCRATFLKIRRPSDLIWEATGYSPQPRLPQDWSPCCLSKAKVSAGQASPVPASPPHCSEPEARVGLGERKHMSKGAQHTHI